MVLEGGVLRSYNLIFLVPIPAKSNAEDSFDKNTTEETPSPIPYSLTGVSCPFPALECSISHTLTPESVRDLSSPTTSRCGSAWEKARERAGRACLTGSDGEELGRGEGSRRRSVVRPVEWPMASRGLEGE